MQPKEIGQAYDKLTHLWERPDFNRDNGIAQHQRAIAFVKNKELALDVGCGCSGRLIDLMLESGFSVEGLDISANMLAIAKAKHPNVTFYQQDICQFQLPHQYDFISAWDSIWHVPLAKQASVIKKLVESLNPGGILIFSFGGTDKSAEHVDNAMGEEVYYSTLGSNCFLKLLIELGCQIQHLEYEKANDLHAYMIIQTKPR